MNDELLKLAEAQLIGFLHCSKGYNVKSLAESMGLTKNEWLKLKHSVNLKQTDKDLLDMHFGVTNG